MSQPIKKRPRRWWQFLLLGVVAALLGVKFFVVDLYTVPQEGMVPTIAKGGRFFGKRHPYHDASAVKRGDVIVFWQDIADGRYQFVWRVVGLPGDRVEAVGDTVSVNGRALPRELVRSQDGLSVYREHNGDASYEVAYPPVPASAPSPPGMKMTVPPNAFFMLGDNRYNARDSRVDGAVPFDHIVAKKL